MTGFVTLPLYTQNRNADVWRRSAVGPAPLQMVVDFPLIRGVGTARNG